MRYVGELFAGTPTTNSLSNSNSSTSVGTLTLDQFKLRHPNSTATITFEGFQAISAKSREISYAANGAKSSRFERTPQEIEHIKGVHRRADAPLRLEPFSNKCRCLDPFTPYHREVCMRWER